MATQQFLVLGLGRFGQRLALDLIELGAEVLGVDIQEDRVAEIADRLSHSAVADSTDRKTLEQLGVPDFDAVICAIGNDIEASVMSSLLLKELGSKKLVAKASSEIHGKILSKVGVERVIFPEREVASRLARDFLAPADLFEVVSLTVQHSMFEVKAPGTFAGHTLAKLALRQRFGWNVVAIRRADATVVSPLAEEVVRRDDLLVVVGDRSSAREALEGHE